MKLLFELNNKTIYDIDTTILYTSSFKYTDDAVYYLNHDCIVITRDRENEFYQISDNIFSLFHEEELKNKSDLTEIDKLKLKILASLNSSRRVYVFFNVLTYLDSSFKEILFKYLSEYHKRIINYTTDIEEVLFLDYVVILQDDKVIMEGAKKLVLREEKILKKLGFRLPFIVSLSSGLKYYGLVEKEYFDSKELVDALWK